MLLDLLFDNRTSDRPEIVIQVLNEEVRLQWQCDYFADYFDIVILDGGSVDHTLEVAKRAGITAFRRRPGAVGFEYNRDYFEMSPHDKYFVSWSADEFADKEILRQKIANCAVNDGVVMTTRVDWFYGKRTRGLPKPAPLAWRRELCSFDPHNLHGAFQLTNPDCYKEHIEVEHLQVLTAYRYFGGPVIRDEIVQRVTEAVDVRSSSAAKHMLCDAGSAVWSRAGWARLFGAVFFILARMLVRVYSSIERRLLLNERDQYNVYRTLFYQDHTKK